MSNSRIVTGAVGASEGLVEVEFQIEHLSALDAFFAKIATIQLHEEWGAKMAEVIVSGSTRWDVYRFA